MITMDGAAENTDSYKVHMDGVNYYGVLVYAIVWLAIAFGINSASNAGSKAVIACGEAKQYYIFQAALWELLIPSTTVNHTSTN